jgi:predicted nucleic-acid-binding Zn-ribbon protein
MPLSEDQQQRFQRWATGRGITHTCPSCGLPELSLNDEIVTTSVHEGDPEFSGNIVLGGAQMPLASVSCANCAYVMFFAAGTIGMVQHGIETPAPGADSDTVALAR